MKVTGIIAEYNPFHNGHAYHLKEARERLKADYVVVVMSGNFVQRGAPTIIDKYSRAEMALKSGADLVLELPVLYATASAEYFAFGGVNILDRLGVVEKLCFGTETLDEIFSDDDPSNDKGASIDLTESFSKIADVILQESDEYKEILQASLKSGHSHAAAVSEAVGAILGDRYVKIMETSNNILGVEYLKAIKRLNSSIRPAPIARMLTEHNDTRLSDGFASATAIRNAIYNKYDMNALSTMVPEEAFDILMDKYLVTFPVYRDDFSAILGEKILSADSPSELTDYFGISPDLANRFMNLRNSFSSFTQFREAAYTKNLNKATVGRALMHIVLGIKNQYAEGLLEREKINAVKVLGFREEAKPLLTEIKNKGSIKLVTSLADYKCDDFADPINLTTKADLLYRMICMNKYNVNIKTPYEAELIIPGGA
ncbi:MAG: nucleotidyltransferase family protein [Parasporobacterium sp.]|nr:nucleotidyltransferase family protein [Parasporobacterium sp.]